MTVLRNGVDSRLAAAFLAAWPWLLIGAAVAFTLSVFVWWLWWRLPKWQVDHFASTIHDRVEAEDNFRKTAGQLLGGAAVLIGAGAAYLQFQQQQTSAHDLLISNQVSKGFELLGNKDGQLEQRLGGIYNLAGIQLTGAYLGGANLVRTDLSGAELGGANLTAANLVGADLDNANLSGADLGAANLTGAFLTEANLTGANLTGANLSGADQGGEGLTQEQLNKACGTNPKLDPPLTFQNKPCPR